MENPQYSGSVVAAAVHSRRWARELKIKAEVADGERGRKRIGGVRFETEVLTAP